MTDQTDHRVHAVKDKDSIDFDYFEPSLEIPVIDEAGTLEQCGDWAFVVELLEDFLNDRDVYLEKLNLCVKDNDNSEFHKIAHTIKGAALNLHLPALVDVSKRLELLGKQLEFTPDVTRLLSQRQPLVDALLVEFENLEGYLPKAREHALQAEPQAD